MDCVDRLIFFFSIKKQLISPTCTSILQISVYRGQGLQIRVLGKILEKKSMVVDIDVLYSSISLQRTASDTEAIQTVRGISWSRAVHSVTVQHFCLPFHELRPEMPYGLLFAPPNLCLHLGSGVALSFNYENDKEFGLVLGWMDHRSGCLNPGGKCASVCWYYRNNFWTVGVVVNKMKNSGRECVWLL